MQAGITTAWVNNWHLVPKVTVLRAAKDEGVIVVERLFLVVVGEHLHAVKGGERGCAEAEERYVRLGKAVSAKGTRKYHMVGIVYVCVEYSYIAPMVTD